MEDKTIIYSGIFIRKGQKHAGPSCLRAVYLYTLNNFTVKIVWLAVEIYGGAKRLGEKVRSWMMAKGSQAT